MNATEALAREAIRDMVGRYNSAPGAYSCRWTAWLGAFVADKFQRYLAGSSLINIDSAPTGSRPEHGERGDGRLMMRGQGSGVRHAAGVRRLEDQSAEGA